MQDVEAAAEASQTEAIRRCFHAPRPLPGPRGISWRLQVSQGVVETRRKAQLLESQIDEVPHLEVLTLAFSKCPHSWKVEPSEAEHR